MESAVWLVDSYQHMCLPIVRASGMSTERLEKTLRLTRIEASSISRQQFVTVFADCFRAVHTHHLEFANTSLPTLVCRVKATLKNRQGLRTC